MVAHGPRRLVSLRSLLVRGAQAVAADDTPDHHVDRPYAWTHDDGSLTLAPEVEALDRTRVTQCALSRVCGVCAEPLRRPVAFVGTDEERARNAFHAPPLHQVCADALVVRREVAGAWTVTTTSGFEFVRPGRDEPETRPTFQPNSLL
ncbi:MAG: hypothetical protein CMH83_08095 [Nocardioides sp.]|nr:hypothetical protein [Nocardioides sp.]